MKNWFKAKYENVAGYSPDWYGIMDYAPPATILLYDDNICECIGWMDSDLPDDIHLTHITEEAGLIIIANYVDGAGIWFGEKLEKRWLPPEENMEVMDG